MPSKQTTRKRAWEMGATRNIKAIALIHDGKPAGKIVAVYGATGGCTTSVAIHHGPLAEMPVMTETAGGRGYNKLDACLESILPDYDPACRLSPLPWLEQIHGYTVVEVL